MKQLEPGNDPAGAQSRLTAGLGIKCFANMDFGLGNTDSWLEITKYKDEVFFCRDRNGVHAWHCGSLPINDRRILEIRN